MLIVIIIAIIIVVIVVNKQKNKSDSLLASNPEILEKIKASACTKAYTNFLVSAFSPGGEQFQWLLGSGSRDDRQVGINFYINAVGMYYIDFNPNESEREHGNFIYTFSSFGFDSLPNSTYVRVFRAYIIQEMKKQCPDIEFVCKDERIKMQKSTLKRR